VPHTAATWRGYLDRHIAPLIGGRPLGAVNAEVLDSRYAQLRRCRDHSAGRPSSTAAPTSTPATAAGPSTGSAHKQLDAFDFGETRASRWLPVPLLIGESAPERHGVERPVTRPLHSDPKPGSSCAKRHLPLSRLPGRCRQHHVSMVPSQHVA
jgi:hypothetical protein